MHKQVASARLGLVVNGLLCVPGSSSGLLLLYFIMNRSEREREHVPPPYAPDKRTKKYSRQKNSSKQTEAKRSNDSSSPVFRPCLMMSENREWLPPLVIVDLEFRHLFTQIHSRGPPPSSSTGCGGGQHS